MRHFFLHITTFTLSTLILFGQVGVNLHSLYCACKDQWQSAFTQPQDACDAYLVPEAAPGCCSAAGGCAMMAELPQNDAHPNCTKRSVQYLQQDLTATATSLEQLDLEVTLSNALYTVLPAYTLPTEQPSTLPSEQEPPPPRYGMALRQYLHSFLC